MKVWVLENHGGSHKSLRVRIARAEGGRHRFCSSAALLRLQVPFCECLGVLSLSGSDDIFSFLLYLSCIAVDSDQCSYAQPSD